MNSSPGDIMINESVGIRSVDRPVNGVRMYQVFNKAGWVSQDDYTEEDATTEAKKWISEKSH